MARYAALLRGVSPRNCKMPALARAFEALGFTDVKTVISSGNVLFSTRSRSEASLEKRIEDQTEAELGHRFMTLVRDVDDLRALVEADSFAAHPAARGAKHVVSFVRTPPKPVTLPVELRNATVLEVRGREIFTAYKPSPGDAAFMQLIERTFGTDITTRTWETVVRLTR